MNELDAMRQRLDAAEAECERLRGVLRRFLDVAGRGFSTGIRDRAAWLEVLDDARAALADAPGPKPCEKCERLARFVADAVELTWWPESQAKTAMHALRELLADLRMLVPAPEGWSPEPAPHQREPTADEAEALTRAHRASVRMVATAPCPECERREEHYYTDLARQVEARKHAEAECERLRGVLAEGERITGALYECLVNEGSAPTELLLRMHEWRRALIPDRPAEPQPESVEAAIERCRMDIDAEPWNIEGEYWAATANTANGTALVYARGPDLATAVRKCAEQYDARADRPAEESEGGE